MIMQLSEIYDILFNNKKIIITSAEHQKLKECYDFLEDFKKDKVIYGINTGFGPMAQYRVSDEHLQQLQYNIIRSHSAGAGEPMPIIAVRAALISRYMTFMQYRSGIHPNVVDQIVAFINNGITPYVPQHGSVGASGDLVQLAHIALTLIGEGKVFYNNQWMPTIEAFKQTGLKPMPIHGRDGLSIVNGTAMMTGLGLINLIYAKRIAQWVMRLSVMTNEIAGSYDDFMAPEINSVRRQEGQQEVAELMREMAQGSKMLADRQTELYNGTDETLFHRKVQPYYSLRCVPQVMGPIVETLHNAERVLINEVNSADDNPIVDPVARNIYHGGNFHGDYISFEMDKLKIAVAKMTMLAERQMNYLFHDKINDIEYKGKTLPPFVNLGTLGLNYGMQACQFTATSTTAESQTLSNPMYVHSIPNNNDNQDIVSMGTNSALIAKHVVDNAYQVVAIHLMSICQAIDCLGCYDDMSAGSKKVYDDVRKIFPVFKDDTEKYTDIANIQEYLRTTSACAKNV